MNSRIGVSSNPPLNASNFREKTFNNIAVPHHPSVRRICPVSTPLNARGRRATWLQCHFDNEEFRNIFFAPYRAQRIFGVKPASPAEAVGWLHSKNPKYLERTERG